MVRRSRPRRVKDKPVSRALLHRPHPVGLNVSTPQKRVAEHFVLLWVVRLQQHEVDADGVGLVGRRQIKDEAANKVSSSRDSHFF